MDKVTIKMITLLCFFLLLITSIVIAQPTEKSLIMRWESTQKNDPKTVVFEKLEDRLYKFKTEWFPFDGELKILNVIIEDRTSFYYKEESAIPGGYATGIIEIELVDIPKEIREKYIYSYSKWAENNTLYFDIEANKWLSQKERWAIEEQRAQESPYGGGYFWNYFDPITAFFILFFIFLLYILLKTNKANKKYMNSALDTNKRIVELSEKAVTLNEKTNKLLGEISQGLKGKK